MRNLSISLSYAAGYYTTTFESFVDKAASCGFRGVQLIPDQHPNLYSNFSKARIVALREMIEHAQMYATIHNVFYDINPTSLIDEVQVYSLGITGKVMNLAKALGAKDVTIHPGYMYPGWVNDPKQHAAYLASARRGIEGVIALAKDIGVRALFENGSYRLTSLRSQKSTPFHFGIEIYEMRKIVEFSGDQAKICFDVGKAMASGVDVGDFIDEFGDKIVQIQFSSLEALDEILRLVNEKNMEVEKLDFVYEGRDQSHLTEIAARCL